MKKTELLNSMISYEIAKIGHMQTLTVGDAGLPIPKDVVRIDLAIVKNLPRFLDVLDAVLAEMRVEEIILAEEIKQKAPELKEEIIHRFDNIKVRFISHEDFKAETKNTNAIIRTGETTPYANVILVSGVTF